MPIGYPITTGGLAAAAISAVIRLRPRRSSPFRLSYIFGLWLNWPFVVFLFLVGSTALAINQTGLGSWGLWIGLCLAIVALSGLVVLRRRALETSPVLERALDEGIGAGWRDQAGAELVARLRRRPSLYRILVAPIASRRHGVERRSQTSATALPVVQACSTSIAIAPIDPPVQSSSTSTRSSAASVSEHATCSIGLPARAGCASARTTAVVDAIDIFAASVRSARRLANGL